MRRREARRVAEEFNGWAKRVFSNEGYELTAKLENQGWLDPGLIKLYLRFDGELIDTLGFDLRHYNPDGTKREVVGLIFERPGEFNVNIASLTEKDREPFEDYLSRLKWNVEQLQDSYRKHERCLETLKREYNLTVERKEAAERVFN